MSQLKLTTFGGTHTGGRANNEDAYAIHRNNTLQVVADGMGGHVGGEMASAAACQSFAESAKVAPANFDSTDAAKTWLFQCLQDAQLAVANLNGQGDGLQRMGTTATLSLMLFGKLLVAWVGDSRVYRLRGQCLELINDDHVVKYEQWLAGQLTDAQWAAHRRGYTSNVITRALDGGKQVNADFRETDLIAGDVVLTCSDGLNNTLTDNQMTNILSSGQSAQQIAEELVKYAVSCGAKDNVTAVVSLVEKTA